MQRRFIKGFKNKSCFSEEVRCKIASNLQLVKWLHVRNIVDPDPHSIYTKRKEHQNASDGGSSKTISGSRPLPKYPSQGWSNDLKRMPFFSRAEMNSHISKSGKNVDFRNSHSVPTSVRKATTFLNDEYLKDLSAASDDNYFYFHCHCHHSFRKNDPPHNLKVALCVLSGEVIDASCSCVAGQVGYCNHIVALSSTYTNAKVLLTLTVKRTCSQNVAAHQVCSNGIARAEETQ